MRLGLASLWRLVWLGQWTMRKEQNAMRAGCSERLAGGLGALGSLWARGPTASVRAFRESHQSCITTGLNRRCRARDRSPKKPANAGRPAQKTRAKNSADGGVL